MGPMKMVFWLMLLGAARLAGAESDALAIDANLQARHLPFGTVVDPIFAGPESQQIVGYSRCGDSALWTGHYLAAEAFRYQVTRSAEALDNVRHAVAGLQTLVDVTGNGVLARCAFAASSPYAAGIESEEAANGVYTNFATGMVWIGHTSRDQYSGVFFGLGVAYDLVDDAGVRASVAALVGRLLDFLLEHGWSVVMPDGSIATSFLARQDQILSLLQVGRHISPARYAGPFDEQNVLLKIRFLIPLTLDAGSDDSYFKFNLDYINLYNLIRLGTDATYREGYAAIRLHTWGHQNSFFDLMDRALNGANAVRDAETMALLDQWLQRPRRDVAMDLAGRVPVCGGVACQPIPVAWRVPTDFLWQRSPFQLAGGGKGLIEGAGIDYLLPYWMARYYGVSAAFTARSAASGGGVVAPGSYVSLYGSNLHAGMAVLIMGPDGAARNASLTYAGPGQINLILPENTPTGMATLVAGSQTGAVAVAAVAPALFSMDASGSGVAAATAVRVASGNAALQTPVAVVACQAGSCRGVPIALADGLVYVALYGTGIRNRSALGKVTVQAGGVVLPALFAGPQPEYAGLDQVNFQLPASLAGRGEIAVTVTADGQTSNPVTLTIH